MFDTNVESEFILIEFTRRAPLWKRAAQLADLIEARQTLILADLRRRYPHADADELHERLAARLLPREEVIRIFNWDADKEGY